MNEVNESELAEVRKWITHPPRNIGPLRDAFMKLRELGMISADCLNRQLANIEKVQLARAQIVLIALSENPPGIFPAPVKEAV